MSSNISLERKGGYCEIKKNPFVTSPINDIINKEELILRENPNRFVLFPIKYKNIWDAYKNQKACFWTAEEIDLSRDLNDWNKLTDNEQYFIKTVRMVPGTSQDSHTTIIQSFIEK